MAEERENEQIDYRDQPFEVVIDGSSRRFANYKEFKKWHDGQWAGINTYIAGAEHYRQDIRNRYNNLYNSINTFDNSANQITEGHLADLVTYIENLYQVVYPADSIRGGYLVELANESPETAAGAFNYWRKWRIGDLNTPDYFRGAVLAELFDRGVPDKTSQIDALEQAEAEYRDWHSEAKSTFDTLEELLRSEILRSAQLVDDANENADKYRESLSEWAKTFKRVSEQRKDKILEEAGKQRDKLKADIEQLIKTYDDDLALQWPTTYWQNKAQEHARLANKYTKLFVRMAIVTLIVTLTLSVALVTPLEDYFTTAFFGLVSLIFGFDVSIFTQPHEVSPFAKITAFGAILAIVIWILKIVARNMTSQQHLAADAEERRVMILTYLALLRRGKGVGEKELVIVLSTIFRPSVDGLVKEDGGPSPIPIEILKLLGRN